MFSAVKKNIAQEYKPNAPSSTNSGRPLLGSAFKLAHDTVPDTVKKPNIEGYSTSN